MEELYTFVIVFGVSLIAFLLCREIVCWYFKVNTITKQLEDIKTILQKAVEQKNK